MEGKWARMAAAGVFIVITGVGCASPFKERQVPAGELRPSGCRGMVPAGQLTDEVEAAYDMRRPDLRNTRRAPIPENLLLNRERVFEELTCGNKSVADPEIRHETIVVCGEARTVNVFRAELRERNISDTIGRHEAVDKFAAIECPVSFWQKVVDKVSNFL